MTILDDTKRALKGAKPLLDMMKESTPATFEQYMDRYTDADGIIDSDFLDVFERAKTFLPQVADLDNQETFFSFPFPFQMAFVEHILESGNYALLPELARQATDKVLAKQLKKRIHELKAKGIKIEPPKKGGNFKLHKVEDPPPPSLVSESNSLGEREIFYVTKNRAGSGVIVLYTVAEFQRGITEFRPMETNRSGLRDMIRSMSDDPNLRSFEVAPEIARYLIDSARKVNEEVGTALPPRFLTTLQQEFPKPERTFEKSPVWEKFDPREVEDRFSDFMTSAVLHEKPEFRHWVLPREVLQAVEGKFQEVLYSTVLVDQRQKLEQIQKMAIETVDGYFAPSIRPLWIRRLEDAAYLADLDSRRDDALLALTVACALSDQTRAASAIPFCERLLGKLLDKPLEQFKAENEQKEKKPSGIILP